MIRHISYIFAVERQKFVFIENRIRRADIFEFKDFNQFILRVEDRDNLLEYLKSKNIGCEIYYPVALHQQECFTYLGYKDGDFPVSESAAQNTIAIPIYPELSAAQKEYIIKSIKSFYE